MDTSRKKTLETRCQSHSPTANLKVRPRPTRPTLFPTTAKSCPSFRDSMEDQPTSGQDSRQRSSTTSSTRMNAENRNYQSNEGFLIRQKGTSMAFSSKRDGDNYQSDVHFGLKTLFWLGGMFVQDILFLKTAQNRNITFLLSREHKPPAPPHHHSHTSLITK